MSTRVFDYLVCLNCPIPVPDVTGWNPTDEKSSGSGITVTSSDTVDIEEIGENSRHSVITFILSGTSVVNSWLFCGSKIPSGSIEMALIIEKDCVSGLVDRSYRLHKD